MITFAITAYNEMSDIRLNGQRLLRCIESALAHEAVSEIVIVDDGSADFEKLAELLSQHKKIRLYHGEVNVGVFTNKVEAIARATNPWVITCDSDNVMDNEYINTVLALEKTPAIWYCPSFAKPQFDYRHLIGTYNSESIKQFLWKPVSRCAVNTGNQIVHRNLFMEVFDRFRGVRRFDLLLPNYLGVTNREDEKWHLVYGANDSFILVKLWLDAGNSIHLVPGLEYEHTVHTNNRGASNYDRAPVEKLNLSTELVNQIMGIPSAT